MLSFIHQPPNICRIAATRTMGVGDYVHSKETGQFPSPANGTSNSFPSRQALAEQVKVGVPTTKLITQLPSRTNGRIHQEYYETQEDAMQRDMFDTDVEGIDDSTIAGTSVLGADEHVPSGQDVQYQHDDGSESRPLYQSQHSRRVHEAAWHTNLGDQVMKTAGFESDDADITEGSQPTSVPGDDTGDEKTPVDDWYLSSRQKRRSVEDQPLSKRLETFWAASKRTHALTKSTNSGPEEQFRLSAIPTSTASGSRNPSRSLPNRKITLPRSMTTTPRTRFSPPKPSLLEQLELSPTRQTAGQRPQHDRQRSTGFVFPADEGEWGSDSDTNDSPVSVIALNKHSINGIDNDNDDRNQEIFSKHSSTTQEAPPSPLPKKRHIEADYPPEVLYQKSFSDLQAEPFDYTPSPPAPSQATSTTTTTTPPPTAEEVQDTPKDRVSFALGLSEEERRAYFSKLSMTEWEECGDQIIDHFTALLSKMKELRQARRKTAALFEAEIKRRHDEVEQQDSELSTKLLEMREGGIGMLRGKTPDSQK